MSAMQEMGKGQAECICTRRVRQSVSKEEADGRVFTRRVRQSEADRMSVWQRDCILGRSRHSIIQGGDGQSAYKEAADRVVQGDGRQNIQNTRRWQTEFIQGDGR
jgi:hypothetical protein